MAKRSEGRVTLASLDVKGNGPGVTDREMTRQSAARGDAAFVSGPVTRVAGGPRR